MYQITIKFKDDTEEIIIERDYNNACILMNDKWSLNVKSLHLKEVK